MPEGPSIVIAKNILSSIIKGKVITHASGNAKIEWGLLPQQKVLKVDSWGKHLLICLAKCTIKIHFLMFGSYSVDAHTKKDSSTRLKLVFAQHTIYFYTCSVKLLEEDLHNLYDWEADVLNDHWNARKARLKLKRIPESMVCDALLDQQIFSGVGNIIKNEVLYRIKLHPETFLENIPPRKLTELIKEARTYSFDFLRWKKEYTLKQHWLAHTKKMCARCQVPFTKKYCGNTRRRTFFCSQCQVKYA